MTAEPLVHYELREFHGDFDLCRVTGDGLVLGIAAEVHDREILDRIAEAFQAKIIRREDMPA
jgi:hypothetical protein